MSVEDAKRLLIQRWLDHDPKARAAALARRADGQVTITHVDRNTYDRQITCYCGTKYDTLKCPCCGREPGWEQPRTLRSGEEALRKVGVYFDGEKWTQCGPKDSDPAGNPLA